MKIMLSILGEGRGHMTQAMAVKEMVEKAGHQICGIVMGVGPNRVIPPFFTSAINMPVTKIPTLDFSYQNNRKVNMPATVLGIIRKIPAYRGAVRTLKKVVQDTRPDVIINFFEPITGLYALTCRKRPPIVAVAHQFMCGHPEYVRAPGRWLQQLGMKWYVNFVGSASTKLALSLYDAAPIPSKKLTVSPPILRRQLFELNSNPNGNFVLAYLLNHGYAAEIIEWHKRNPQTSLHCFYDKPGAPAEEKIDETLTFHRLDGEKFLRLMAECKYVACTAGFESLCEAAYLGKPLFVMPVENHIEQQINALDAVRARLAVTDSKFNLDRLAELPDRLENETLRAWFNRAASMLLTALERAVREAGPVGDVHLESGRSKLA